MKALLNTLFVNTENAYATLDGENVAIKEGSKVIGRFPLHILENIYLFTYRGASPTLMGKCAVSGINLVFCTPNGRFLARTVGESRGNVLLRKKQYSISDDVSSSVHIVRNCIIGKVSNSKRVVERTLSDHSERIDKKRFIEVKDQLANLLYQIVESDDIDTIRGYEGVAASIYFSVMDEMILRNKNSFYYKTRSKRPPMDKFNALLSFVYSMLSNDCASALEAVGLDSYVGFMHSDRPGRKSLALDIMEELRACMADRFSITLVNNNNINSQDFEIHENGAVFLSESGRKIVQRAWQDKKHKMLMHPFLKERIEWGLIPYVQAILLARHLRGDIDGYPPFIWK